MAELDPVTLLRKAMETASSPLERMKILARAWRVVRELAPDHRAAVAAQVGIEGAEEIVERLGRGKRRLSPAFLLQALERVKAQDPQELGRLVRDLRDPERRKEVLRRELRRAAETLDVEPAPAAENSAPPVPPVASPTSAIPTATSTPVGSHRQPAADSGERLRPPPSVEQRLAEPERAPVLEAPPAVEAAIPVARPERSAKLRPPADSVAPLAGPVDWIRQVADRPSVLLRLALARRQLAGTARLAPPEIRRLLSAFPEPWARRRVLAAMLARRIPDDLSLALELIEGLEQPASRRWCRSVLRHQWNLEPGELAETRECGPEGTFVSR